MLSPSLSPQRKRPKGPNAIQQEQSQVILHTGKFMRTQVGRQMKRTEEQHKQQEKNTAGAREKITVIWGRRHNYKVHQRTVTNTKKLQSSQFIWGKHKKRYSHSHVWQGRKANASFNISISVLKASAPASHWPHVPSTALTFSSISLFLSSFSSCSCSRFCTAIRIWRSSSSSLRLCFSIELSTFGFTCDKTRHQKL